jgi:hypothetical protein
MSDLPSMPTNYDLQGEPNPYAAYSVEQLHQFSLPLHIGTRVRCEGGVFQSRRGDAGAPPSSARRNGIRSAIEGARAEAAPHVRRKAIAPPLRST